jgi:hypothetical protein
MSTRQSEFRRAVIERRRLPHRGGVTGFASVTEIGSRMIRIRRLRKICGVARITVGIHKLVVAVDMTRLTWRRQMCPR